MTFSLLAYDADSCSWGGVAATGNLCVGGWVLRGRAGAGISASQGHSPSTIWGEHVLKLMEQGVSATEAVTRVVQADRGRDWRQLSALDKTGRANAFSGNCNSDFKGHLIRDGLVASGNILAGQNVLEAMVAVMDSVTAPFEDRLLAALEAGRKAGGDERGIQSAAMLVVRNSAPPLDLRIDWHEQPISALEHLLAQTRRDDYQAWLDVVPTVAVPERTPKRKTRVSDR